MNPAVYFIKKMARNTLISMQTDEILRAFFFCHNVKKQCNNFNKKVTIINFSVTNFKTNVTYISKACDNIYL